MQAHGVAIADAFDACTNLKLTQASLQSSFAEADKRGLIGARAERFVIRSWWRPGSRFVSDEGYERAVDAERKRSALHIKTIVRGTTVPSKKAAQSSMNSEKAPDFRPLAVAGPVPTAREPRPPTPWDVYSASRGAGVLVFSKPNPKATP